MRIGVIHATITAAQPLMDCCRSLYPDTKIINYIDENLLSDADRDGSATASGLRRFLKMLTQAAEDQVDGILIACSVYCQYQNLGAAFVDVPLVAIDEPMIAAALSCGERIGLIATTEAALPVTAKQLEQRAALKQELLTIKKVSLPQAMTALREGRGNEHDQLIVKAVFDLLDSGCDAVILCQVTMARAIKAIPESSNQRLNQIFTSPERGLRSLMEQIYNGRNPHNMEGEY